MGKKRLYSRKFFLFNMVALGVIAGFSLALVSFSCSSGMEPAGSAYADDVDTRSMENLENMQYSFRQVAESVLPVVVEINVVEVRTQTVPEGRTPWDFFFPQPPGEGEEKQPEEREFRNRGLGSGVIVRKADTTYYVLTNNHVVGEADEISIRMNDGREFQAELVGMDQRKDLALISFEAEEKDIPVASLGNSDDLYVGDWVLAVGNPLGFESTVTAGIVSALERKGPSGNISDFIQTDAAINRGNSGGALVNIRGEVVGINTWITSPTGGSIGLGFAIPINNAKKAIDDLITKGRVEYGWLGVSIADGSEEFAEDMNVEPGNGAFVLHVFGDSPADKGGINPGDYIVSIDGEDINNANELTVVVGELPPSEPAEFVWIRDGKRMSEKITIAVRQEDKEIAAKSKNLWPGFTIHPITKDVRNEFGIPRNQKGVLVTSSEPKSPAGYAGVKAGDIVTEIDGSSINSARDFYSELNEAGKSVDVKILREEDEILLTIHRQ
ncbi:MAG: Do family serine endopeptidase [Spirochaetales bacterium]|nr:Do family serine endopeptidase [Spirochaetales bacterium]MCF7939380.1 Do family serine endopeptidase [Spirochaetales bacterium]